MGQQCVSNIALVNIEIEYANSVVNNHIDRTIDIFGHRNGRDGFFFSFFFNVFYELIIESYVRIFSLHR